MFRNIIISKITQTQKGNYYVCIHIYIWNQKEMKLERTIKEEEDWVGGAMVWKGEMVMAFTLAKNTSSKPLNYDIYINTI